jgi:hypothetical protein
MIQRPPMPRPLECLLVAAPLLAVLMAGLLGVSVPLMTLDMPSITRVHPLSGFLSSLGILLLGAATALWYFGATTAPAAGPRATPEAARRMMLMGAAVSAYMTLDDLFQVHEIIAPRYLGVPDEAVLGLLAAALLVFLRMAWRMPDRTGLFWLLAALAWLGASVVVDAASRWLWRLGEWQYFVEDGAKWLGLCCWLNYAVVFCRERLGGTRVSPTAAPDTVNSVTQGAS